MSKIKAVQIIFKPMGVWSKRSESTAWGNYPVNYASDLQKRHLESLLKGKDGMVFLFQRKYDSGVPIKAIWNDIRKNMKGSFYDIFYPSVIAQTNAGKPKVNTPEAAAEIRSWHIKQQMMKNPDGYVFDIKEKKWMMSKDYYKAQVEGLGGEEKFGIGKLLFEGESALASLSKPPHEEWLDLPLFLYPDKYDQKIRAEFILRIWFY